MKIYRRSLFFCSYRKQKQVEDVEKKTKQCYPPKNNNVASSIACVLSGGATNAGAAPEVHAEIRHDLACALCGKRPTWPWFN